jgi:hypothetical protein
MNDIKLLKKCSLWKFVSRSVAKFSETIQDVISRNFAELEKIASRFVLREQGEPAVISWSRLWQIDIRPELKSKSLYSLGQLLAIKLE